MIMVYVLYSRYMLFYLIHYGELFFLDLLYLFINIF